MTEDHVKVLDQCIDLLWIQLNLNCQEPQVLKSYPFGPMPMTPDEADWAKAHVTEVIKNKLHDKCPDAAVEVLNVPNF